MGPVLVDASGPLKAILNSHKLAVRFPGPCVLPLMAHKSCKTTASILKPRRETPTTTAFPWNFNMLLRFGAHTLTLDRLSYKVLVFTSVLLWLRCDLTRFLLHEREIHSWQPFLFFTFLFFFILFSLLFLSFFSFPFLFLLCCRGKYLFWESISSENTSQGNSKGFTHSAPHNRPVVRGAT